MKVAYCFHQGNANKNIAKKMGHAQSLFSHQDCQTFDFGDGGVSFVSGGDRHSTIPTVRFGKNGNHLIVTGIPITNNGSIETRLNEIVNSDYQNAGNLISDLNGAFAITYWDGLFHKLLIVTDCLGMQPLYMVHKESLFLIGSEIKALAASGLINPEMDLSSWGSFISAGYAIGDRTMLSGVNRASRAKILTYDPIRNTLKRETYWNQPEFPSIRNKEKVPVDEIMDLLREDICAYTEHGVKGQMLFSGGFGSRMLASILKKEEIPFKALIIKYNNATSNANIKYIKRLAKLIDVDYTYIKSSRNICSNSEYINYLIMSDMAITSLYLFIAQISAYTSKDMKVIWDGAFLGHSLKSIYTIGGFDTFIENEFASKSSIKWKAAELVFSPKLLKEMYEGFIDVLTEERKKLPDNDYGVSRFLINNRHRNRTALNPLQVYANHTLPFMPGLNKEYWSITSSISQKIKVQNMLPTEILRRHFPDTLGVPLISGFDKLNKKQLIDRSAYRIILQKTAGTKLPAIFRMKCIWPPSGFVNAVSSSVNPGHPDLNSDGVVKLKKENNKSQLYQTARNQLFYWQIWRWLVDGKLNMQKNSIFTGESESIN